MVLTKDLRNSRSFITGTFWCGQRDSNPTSHLRRRLLRPLCLPTAYTPAYNSQDLGFLREPNTKLRRSFNTTWYSRWDSNPQHLPPEDSASAKLRHDCILRGEPARRLNCATPEVLVIQLFSGQILSRFSSWHGLLGSNQQILGQSQVFCH